MSYYCLLNQAVEIKNYNFSVAGLLELSVIEREDGDTFVKNVSFYNLKIYEELCQTYGYYEQIILQYIEQLNSTPIEVSNQPDLDQNYPNDTNGFLGVDFSNTEIDSAFQITNKASYLKFTNDNLWNVSFRNFWGKRKRLFPSLIICNQVENQILQIGASSQFNQIIKRLMEFNKAVSNWSAGSFSYKEINQKYSLNISPESSFTISQYKNERIFQLPNGGTAIFELHIKTGNFRFHFFPDNKNRKVFIGYIGPHLTI